ncbi:MAG: hypothetical protein IJU75_03620 [Clostridia bacterium]|nr:hypothetical protein [Clostridia bacterium]
MKRTFAIIAAISLLISALALSSFAAEENLVDASAWKCVNDGGDEIVGASGIGVEDGKIIFTELQNNWLHLKQTLTVEPNTRYEVVIVSNLSKGLFRFDVNAALVVKDENGNETLDQAFNENGVKEWNIEGDLNKDNTFTLVYQTGADQTELVIDIRNGSGKGADESMGWFNRAVGTVKSVSVAKYVAATDTADLTAVFAVVAVAAAAAFVLGKKH